MRLWAGLDQPQRGHVAMLAFSALVAGSFCLGAMAAPHVSPSALTVARFALAGALVGLAAFLTVGVPRKTWAAPWRYVVLGGLLACYFVLMFWGLQTAEAVPTAAVFTLTPLMAAGFGWLLLGQITTLRMALALAIGALGALWVIFGGDLAALARFEVGRGEVIYFFGCIAHALYAPMVRKLNRGEPALVFTFGMMLAGFVILCLWGWRDVLATDWAALPAIVWICLVYVSVAASAMTFVLLQFATLRLPSAKVMAYTYLVPSWVILWEIALGRAAPPINVLGGVILTALALFLLLKDETA
ncbi:DMT family transporter [Cypionkella sp.]|uniref:DMT family transporter n=1 Tax=Cypionkella sp. TaxID=2811411 RepID=UPI0027242045|nr:DMT family transporter [Cypionkella sp.]MDO8983392.1 DMT family transporter [Cypionkella sp.]MDP1576107.1 DMT family transporter [Cypionkella sp.]MDP2050236.1 DMT family transporter [Cypionkella sp.]